MNTAVQPILRMALHIILQPPNGGQIIERETISNILMRNVIKLIDD